MFYNLIEDHVRQHDPGSVGLSWEQKHGIKPNCRQGPDLEKQKRELKVHNIESIFPISLFCRVPHFTKAAKQRLGITQKRISVERTMAESFAVPKKRGDRAPRLTLDLVAEEAITQNKYDKFNFALVSTRKKGFRLFCRDKLTLAWNRSWVDKTRSAWAKTVSSKWDGYICEWDWDDLQKRFQKKLPNLILTHYKKLTNDKIGLKNTSKLYSGSKQGFGKLVLNGNIIIDIGVPLKFERNHKPCEPWWHPHGPKFRCADSWVDTLFDERPTVIDTSQHVDEIKREDCTMFTVA